MVREEEFKVIITEKKHIFLGGKLIAVLGAWNRFEDSDDILSQLREKESCLLV